MRKDVDQLICLVHRATSGSTRVVQGIHSSVVRDRTHEGAPSSSMNSASEGDLP